MQETHLTLESNVKLYSPDFPTWYYGDTVSKRARGVAIGFAKGVRFTLEDRMFDAEGRFHFLKGKIGEMVCTMAIIYAPNRYPIKYFSEILGKLQDFKAGKTFLLGDLNFCLEPEVDSMSRVQGPNNAQLKKKKKCIVAR